MLQNFQFKLSEVKIKTAIIRNLESTPVIGGFFKVIDKL